MIKENKQSEEPKQIVVSNCAVEREVKIQWNNSAAAYIFSENLAAESDDQTVKNKNLAETSAYGCPLADGDLHRTDIISVTTMAGVIAIVMCEANCRNKESKISRKYISDKLFITPEPLD